jgi:hypothetical protein
VTISSFDSETRAKLTFDTTDGFQSPGVLATIRHTATADPRVASPEAPVGHFHEI